MATYALGDVHGCFATLQALLARMPWNPGQDRLWLVGDLVNRGPDSLAVLRWARALAAQMGERLAVVLGNHDLHLLACAAGVAAVKPRDTLAALLAAPDAGELLAWLGQQPFVHQAGEHLLVHAGLLPGWTPAQAATWAAQLAAAHRGAERAHLLARRVPAGQNELAALLRAQDAFTRLRTCTAGGEPCLDFSGPPEQAPPGCLPWFAVPGRQSAGVTVVCGHWAALGLLRQPGLLALDSGCAWGGALSAVRLEDGRLFQQPSCEPAGESRT